jgi:isoamylase
LILNAHHEDIAFTLPEVVGGTSWRCLLDTNIPDDSLDRCYETGELIDITGRSMILLALEPESKRSVALRQAIERFRLVAERPIPVANAETGPEEERSLSGSGDVLPIASSVRSD